MPSLSTPRCSLRRALGLACAGLTALLGPAAPALAAPPEVRGTWLTTTGPDTIASGFFTESVMADLRRTGLNTVYVETWKNGYTQFPSPTLDDAIGFDRRPGLGSRDLLEETLIHAHRQQLAHVGWFEYGFAAQFVGSGGAPSNPLATHMRDRGWLLRDQQGRFANASNGFAWMNPAVPEVPQLLIGVVLDAATRYDLDGVQLDDRLAWPREFGWDATTAALYRQQTGRPLPSNVDDPHFRAWRQQQVTDFAAELYAAVKAARPDLHVSVSPSITGFSDFMFNAAWSDWVEQGLFDEYVPQAYRDSLDGFNAIIGPQVDALASEGRLEDLVVGLRGNGSGADTPWNDLRQMIERTRSEGAAGHSVFFSKALLESYAEEFEAFYDVAGRGHAAHPMLPAGHRPPPVVLSEADAAADLWTGVANRTGRYRVVERDGAFWRETGTLLADAGQTVELIAGGAQVELLIDRRPYAPGDYDGDGALTADDIDLAYFYVDRHTRAADLTGDVAIDGEDVAYLVETLIGTVFGDANLDGLADAADQAVVASSWAGEGGWALGDFDGSGAIDAQDVTLLLRHATVERPGDVNDDGTVDNLDIAAFLAAYDAGHDLPAFLADVEGGYLPAADLDRDGLIDAADADAFIDRLADRGLSPTAELRALVPEPATAATLLLGLTLGLRRRTGRATGRARPRYNPCPSKGDTR